MSQTVDSRVVEMRFDNAQFEQNVKQSMSTLDRLKASLNMKGASDSFDELSKASAKVDFSAMSKNIEMLSNRFSTFGIIGMRVIQNLTDSAMKFVHNTMNTVSNSIIGGGKRRAMNIENARFQLQGLLGDEEKVEAIMKDALDSVDGTAYAFDEAAKAASQFAATGMQAGEDMYGALRGITGVAAMTNSEYENIARIFTTVAGNGRMMGDQLLQLSSRGLNAAVTIKDYFNGVNSGAIEANDNIKSYIQELTKGLDMTESDIRDFVSKGKISFDIFAKAMDNAFGEHAKKANDTLTGSISNVRAALARIGAEFISPLVVQKGPLVMFFNALRERINDIKKNIGPLANMFTDTVSSIATSATRYLKGLSFTGFFEEFNSAVTKLHGFLNTQLFDRFGEFTRLITNAGLKLEDFQKAAFDVMADSEIAKAQERNRTVKAELKSYDDFLKKYGSFQASLKTGWMTPTVFSNAIKKLTGDLKPMTEAFKTAEDVVKKFDDISNQVIRGNFGNGAERVKNLTEAGYDYATVQSVVNHKLLGWEIDLNKVTDAQLTNLGYTKEQIEAFKKLREEAETSGSSIEELIKSFNQPTGAELFVGSIQNVIKGAISIVGAFNSAWRETFTDMPTLPLYSFLRMLNRFSEKLILTDDNLANLKNTFKGVFSLVDLGKTALKTIYDLIAGIAKSIDPSFNGFGGYILKITGLLGTTITNIVNFVKRNDIINKVFEPIVGRLKLVFAKLKDFYGEVVNSEGFRSGAGKIVEDVKNFASNIDVHIGNALTLFENFFKTVKDLVNDFSLEKVQEIIKNFAKDAKENLSNIEVNFSDIGSMIFDFIKGLVKRFTGFDLKIDFEQFGKKISDFGTIVADTIKKFNFGGLIAMLGGAATIKFVMALYKLITAPKANIVKSFCGVLDQLSGTIGEFRKSIKYGNMLKLAIAVAIFAGSIASLAQLDTKKLFAATGAIIVLAAALTGLNLLTGSIVKIGAKKGEVKKGSSTLLEMAIALGIIAFSLKNIEALTDPWGTIAKAGAIVAGLVFAAGILDSLNSGTDGKNAFLSVIGFAAALYIVIKALKKLETLDTEAIASRMPVLIKLFAMVGALMIASKFVGKNAAKAGTMMLMLAIALKLMVGTILILSLMKPATLNKGLNAIGKIMEIFAGVMIASNFAGKNAHKAGVLFLAMSVAIIIMVGAIKLMSLLTDAEITRAMYVIKQITVCFSILMVASKFASGEFKTIIALTVAIAALTIAIGALSFIPIPKLAAATIALSAVMGMMSLMIYSTGKMGSAKTTIPNLIAMIGVVSLLALIITSMSTMADPSGAIKIAGALSLLLLSLTIALRVISNTKVFKQETLANLMALTIIVGLLGLIIGIMAQNITNVDSVLPIAASLSILLLSLSAACLILSTVGAAGNAALSGIGALLALMTGITAFVAAIGAINELMGEKDLTYFAEKAIPTLQAIGEAIGSFIGGIVGAFLDTSGLGDIGEGLKSFIQQIADFCTTTETINPDVADIIPKIAGAILAFAAAEFLDGVSNIISKLTGTKTLGDKLTELAEGLTGFADAVAGGKFSDQTVQDAANLAEILATLNEHLPRSNGLAQTILGEKDLSDFGAKLGTLAAGLNNFVANLGSRTYSSDTIDQATTLAGVLSALADGLPRAGGLAGTILGDKDLSDFGSKLGNLAIGLRNFVTNLEGEKYTSDTIDQAVKMAETLQVLSQSCPTSGGLLDKIFGGDDLGSFGTSLESLGTGLNKFASSMKDVDTDSADRAQMILRSLMDAAALEPGTLYSVATEVGQFSLAIETFGKKLDGVDVSKTDTIVSSFSSLVQGSKDVGGIDTGKIEAVVAAVSDLGKIDFTDIGPKIESAANAMSTMASRMIEAFNSGISKAGGAVAKYAGTIANGFVTAVSSKLGIASAAGAKLGSALGDGVSKTAKAMPALVGVALLATVAMVSSYHGKFQSVGQNLASGLAAGLGSVSFSSRITGKLSSAASNARGYYSSFYSAGEHLAQGLANGINARADRAVDAARRMVVRVKSVTQKTAEVASPSKFTIRMGKFFDAGFAKGIDDNSYRVEKSAKDMINGARKGITNTVKMISDIIQNGIDAQPTITPVLDLSQVRAGAGQINGMIGLTPALAVGGNLATINNMMNRSRYSATNDDVVAAIKGLSRKLDNVGGDVYNFDGITYDDGSNISSAVKTLVHAAKIERRV